MVDRHTANRAGIEATPFNDECLGLGGEFQTNLGNLMSHCLETLGNKRWSPDTIERILPELTVIRDQLIDEGFRRSSAYRTQTTETGVDQPVQAYENFAAEYSTTELEYGAGIQFTDAAIVLANNYLEEFYQPKIDQIESAISTKVQDLFSSGSPVTYESIWEGLREFATTDSIDSKNSFLEELHFVLTRELIDDIDEIQAVINSPLSPECLNSVLQAADFFSQPVRSLWAEDQRIVEDQIHRGIYVTSAARNELDERIKLVNG